MGDVGGGQGSRLDPKSEFVRQVPGRVLNGCAQAAVHERESTVKNRKRPHHGSAGVERSWNVNWCHSHGPRSSPNPHCAHG